MLIKRAKADGIQPHVLQLTCSDYQSVLDASGGVDYEKMLLLVTRQLQLKITAVRGRRADTERLVAVYGGALHNDLYPREELKQFTFGDAVRQSTGGRYLEVDLYVPEYIARDANLRKERWYAPWKRRARPGRTTLVRRGPDSYIIVFPPSR
jgi:hypothetical protein